MDIDSPATPTAAPPGGDAPAADPLRRRVIGAGLAGVAVSLLPGLAARVSAGAPDETTTTTSPPLQPTSADVDLLGFARQVELAAVTLYDRALAGGALPEEAQGLFRWIRDSHRSYAEALGGLLGQPSPGPQAEVVDEQGAAFDAAYPELALNAAGFEDVAVATHTDLIGRLVGFDGANLIASVLVVEARHATVLRDLAGVTDLDELLAPEAEPIAAGAES